MKRQSGLAALELAIVLPAFMLILMGIIEWGHYFYVDIATTNAAREGARAAALNYICSCSGKTATCTPASTVTTATANAQAIVNTDLLNSGIPSAQVSTTVTCNTTPTNPTWKVDVTANYQMLTGYLSGLMPSSSSGGSYTRAHAIVEMQGN